MQHGPFQGGAADRVAHPHHAVGKSRAVLLRQTLAAVLFQPPVELLQIILRQFVQRDLPDLRQDVVVDDIFVVVPRGGAKRRLAVVFVPVAQPVPEQHIRLNFSVISPHHAFGELPQFLLTFPLCFGEDILRLGKAAVIIADDNAALPPAVAALSYGAGSAFPFLCQGLSPFPSKRITSDGRPIEVTDTPAGLNESAGIRNSIKQPVMRRDLERAGTEICVLPQYMLTYDENGYCVKKEKCRIPDDIAAKLAEMNK